MLKPAGFENAKGIISSAYLKDPTDPAWKDDPGIKNWRAFMDKYYPEGDKLNSNNVYGYAVAQTHGPGAEAVRRRPHPREHHEAGREPEGLHIRGDAARHQGQHQPG